VSLIVFLQNAWSPFYAGRVWPRQSWLRALDRSRSGKRLKIMIDDLDLCEETTPVVTAKSSGIAPPDTGHILSRLAARQPSVVVACGKQAELALCKLWTGPMIAVPHPAHRVLTDSLYVQARRGDASVSGEKSVTTGLKELIGHRCRCEFSVRDVEWPIAGFPAWVIVDDVDMPMIKMRSAFSGSPMWLHVDLIKRIETTPG
jgi:hypothetical protein